MTTETIERTPAARRKATAAHHLQTLTGQMEQLKKRKEAAACDVGRLCDEIAKAERAGADPKALTTLRRDRIEAESVGSDVSRVCSHIEAELVPAQAELRAADVAGHAEIYNRLVEKQRALAGVIEEAIHTIVETLTVKQGLAEKQDRLQGDAGCTYSELSPAGIRWALQHTLAQQLVDGAVAKNFPPFSRLDWSCRKMADGGNLLPIE